MTALFGRLFEFPYFDHYLELSFLEYEVAMLGERKNVIFIGGGPLPLTPIAYALLEIARARDLYLDLTSAVHQSDRDAVQREKMIKIVSGLDATSYEGGMRIVSVDSSVEAHAKAASLLDSLRLPPLVSATHADGTNLVLPADTEVVVVASMAEPKQKILENIAAQIAPEREIDIIVRSVESSSLRQLLYRPLDSAMIDELEAVIPRFRRIYTFAPPTGSRLINSFEVFRIYASGSEPSELDDVDIPTVGALNH